MDPHATFTQLRQLKLTQDALAKKVFEMTDRDLTVAINGKLTIVKLVLPKNNTPAVQKRLQVLLNKTLRKAQNHIKTAISKLAL